jgi:hypothetical protein
VVAEEPDFLQPVERQPNSTRHAKAEKVIDKGFDNMVFIFETLYVKRLLYSGRLSLQDIMRRRAISGQKKSDLRPEEQHAGQAG